MTYPRLQHFNEITYVIEAVKTIKSIRKSYQSPKIKLVVRNLALWT